MDRIDLTNDVVAGQVLAHTDAGDLVIDPNRYDVNAEIRWLDYVETERERLRTEPAKVLHDLRRMAYDLAAPTNPDWDEERIGRIPRGKLYELIRFFVYPGDALQAATPTTEEAVETTARILPAPQGASPAAPPSPPTRKGRHVA
jgi:hypothetical protein